MLPCKGVCGMNLMISSKEYDFHSLVKVAEMAGLAGVVSFHQSGDDYLVTYPEGEGHEVDAGAVVVLDVKDAAWFESRGWTNQHGGGGLFASDEEIMGWLFDR